MTPDLMQYVTALDQLHHPAMTLIEEGLKTCWERRSDLHHRVLTGGEMAEYILWMVENFGNNNDTALEQTTVPSMLFGGGIAKVGDTILHDPKDQDARKALAALYENPGETQFFLEGQDISAGVFLRYLPAYWRTDDYFEVYYVFSGYCPVSFDRETVTLLPGSVLIVPPGTRKACTCPADDCMVYFFMLRKSTFSQVFWSHLSTQNLMANFFRHALSGDGSTPYLRFETAKNPRVELLLHAIYEEYNRNRKYSTELINSFMSSFFLCLLQEHEETARISKYSSLSWKPEFAEILGEIQENYATLTLEQLSARFGYSRRQLIRIIHNSTGSSFTELQTRMRMEKATRMLTTRTASVEDIALQVGFTDRTSFYRAFRQYFHCTPKQYITENTRASDELD